MTGLDWAMKAVLAHIGIDPETVKSQIAGLGQIIVQAKAQMDRIEADQKLIMAALKIETPTDEATQWPNTTTVQAQPINPPPPNAP